MILDEQGLFSNNQAITASCVSTNILDMGKREVSFGTPIELLIKVTEDFNNLTSLSIAIQTSVDEAFTTPVELAESTILLADLKKEKVIPISFLPKGNLGYMRLSYTVTGTTAPTKGKILAAIVDGVEQSFHNID